MEDNNPLGIALARNALDEIPNPQSDAQTIIGLVKNGGRVTGYQLSDGATVSKAEGVFLAKGGGIRGVGIAHRNGSECPKSLPDDTENNKPSNLPSIAG